MYFFALTEYATVGYVAKRIQMRKNRYMALQKLANEKAKQAREAAQQSSSAEHTPPHGNVNQFEMDHHPGGHPKQTVRKHNISKQLFS